MSVAFQGQCNIGEIGVGLSRSILSVERISATSATLIGKGRGISRNYSNILIEDLDHSVSLQFTQKLLLPGGQGITNLPLPGRLKWLFESINVIRKEDEFTTVINGFHKQLEAGK